MGGNTHVGVFATRSPYRPNGIGLSSVKLDKVALDEENGPVLYVSGIDLLDGTPIYDIKPYIPYTDCHPDASDGFTTCTKEHRLKVNFPQHLLEIYPYDKRDAILGVLAHDPRPAYIQDSEREYGVTFAGYDVKFKVNNNILFVLDVVPIEK